LKSQFAVYNFVRMKIEVQSLGQKASRQTAHTMNEGTQFSSTQ